MKITMLAEITGLRDGKQWPARGDSITIPDDEAEVMIANGLAKKHEKGDEDIVATPEPVSPPAPEITEPPAPETATPPAPAKKAPAKRAAKKAPAKPEA